MTQTHRLSTIFQITRTMAWEQDLAVMLSQFLSGLIDTIPAADAGVLMLYDPTLHRLKAAAAQGYDELFLPHLHIAFGESLSSKVFQTGQIAVKVINHSTSTRTTTPQEAPFCRHRTGHFDAFLHLC